MTQQLQDFDKSQVELNMLLFDPVPGDFIWVSRWLDLAGISNANQAMDLSLARNLGRVIVLYPHQPLPAIVVHAPIIYKFPDDCNLEEEVILGCHQGALFLRAQPDTCLSFARIRDYLEECGANLDNSLRPKSLDVSDGALLEALDQELRRNSPTTRSAHAIDANATIVRHPYGRFLNRTHQELALRLGRSGQVTDPTIPMYMLDCDSFATAKNPRSLCTPRTRALRACRWRYPIYIANRLTE